MVFEDIYDDLKSAIDLIRLIRTQDDKGDDFAEWELRVAESFAQPLRLLNTVLGHGLGPLATPCRVPAFIDVEKMKKDGENDIGCKVEMLDLHKSSILKKPDIVRTIVSSMDPIVSPERVSNNIHRQKHINFAEQLEEVREFVTYEVPKWRAGHGNWYLLDNGDVIDGYGNIKGKRTASDCKPENFEECDGSHAEEQSQKCAGGVQINAH